MADVILNTILQNKRGTASDIAAKNPILAAAEICVELDTGKFKIGDGIKSWDQLDYAGGSDGSGVIVRNVNPDTKNLDYPVGSIWLNSNDNKVWFLMGYYPESNPTTGDWRQMPTLAEILDFDFMRVEDFATIDESNCYVDKTIEIRNSTEGATGNLRVNDEVTGTANDNGLWSASKVKSEIDSSISTAVEEAITLEVDKAVITNADGKLAVSDVTSTELGYLSGLTGNIQGQIDNIPKYNFKNGVSASVADGSDQDTINTAAIAAISAKYTAPAKWDSVVVEVTFTPSNDVKYAQYYFNGTDWRFIYFLSNTVQLANGEIAGLVKSSDDIDFASGVGTVKQANKVKNSLTIGGKTFDGSAPITITPEDIDTAIATTENTGVVKASADDVVNGISVGADGEMSVNEIAVAKLVLNGDTLILDGGEIKLP